MKISHGFKEEIDESSIPHALGNPGSAPLRGMRGRRLGLKGLGVEGFGVWVF